MISNNKNILIWDSKKIPKFHENLVLWQSKLCKQYPQAISIPKIVECNAENLKKKYLKIIYDFGDIRFNGQSIIDHLQI